MNPIIKWFSGILKNPTMIIGFSVVLVVFIFIIILVVSLKPGYEVHYFSPDERIGEELDITERRPKVLKCEGQKKFLRFRGAYNVKRGLKNVTVWLAKRGTAYTFKLEATEEDTAVKVGSLWDGVCAVLNDDIIRQFKDTVTEPLKKSEIFVTVDLEAGMTPKDYEPLTEDDIFDESDREMAGIFGTSIKGALISEDWIRNIGLVGLGFAISYGLQALGILKGFA